MIHRYHAPCHGSYYDMILYIKQMTSHYLCTRKLPQHVPPLAFVSIYVSYV